MSSRFYVALHFLPACHWRCTALGLFPGRYPRPTLAAHRILLKAMHIIKPNRASHTYRQRLCASPAKVFPLLCPVREAEWADGWLPELVISSSGVAECACVFITPD